MSRNTGTGLNFVRRIYPPRVFGMLLALPAVAVVLLTMTALDNMMVGGMRLFLKGLIASALSVLVAWAWVLLIIPGYTLQLEPNLMIVIGATPILVAFPLSVGMISFSLSRRLSHQREELERISRTDDLSQLNNRRYWEESVFKEYERYKRSGAPLSLIMIDIDHFKQVNDEYGHAAGDQMIRELSALFTENVRISDVVGRYGGEEFGVLLPDTDKKRAMYFAERLRLAAQSLSIKPYGARCTISLGVAEVDDSITKYRDLIELADRALYQAKRRGRNISMLYEAD